MRQISRGLLLVCYTHGTPTRGSSTARVAPETCYFKMTRRGLALLFERLRVMFHQERFARS